MPASPPDFEVFVAANEAFAAFEKAVLDARTSITGGFRIFDMRTRLVSDDARAIGETWFDLLVHVLRRGVTLDLTISDFDPIYATELHQLAWATVKQGAALVEAADVPQDRVHVRPALHPATPGMVPWLAFLPVSLRRAKAQRAALKNAARAEAPGVDQGIPGLHTVTHHQKLAVIDDDTLYIGGLDLNDRRFDTPDHDRPAHETWSDVQVIVRNDPVVAEAKQHLQCFDDVVHGRQPPAEVTHLRRTLSADRRFKLPFLSPRTLVSELEEAHLKAITAARHLIYIETQFIRSRVIADALARAATDRPDLSLIMILPAAPEEAAFDAPDELGLETRYGLALEKDALGLIRDGFGKRATIATPVRPVMAARDTPGTRAGSPIIYVHNKVLVQDTDFAMVGSANLNGRSLRWDTEAGVAITDPARIAILRDAVHQHWWRTQLSGEWTDPQQMQPIWQAEIARNDKCHPEKRTGFLVSHDLQTHSAEAQPLPLVTDDMV
ncbi:phospholipase D-like domain-containing protein [uncultured Tateyamaria sp.]|uniref:phospholipase D-like domain-containing protein n=1 Tax=uncultured Tateyamaria sp. TaxID=455651 RepID=UPI002614E231|nr:phospholipase D-like domain-containing protein [uncultured Tateyamaria sp.]